jgi:hypothetical protein
MASDKRRNNESIPNNYLELLTTQQIVGLRGLESFGWSLLYVRRPKFAPVEVVVEHSDTQSHAVLDANGELVGGSTPLLRSNSEASETSAADADRAAIANDNKLRTTKAPPPVQITGQCEPIPINCDTPPAKYLV